MRARRSATCRLSASMRQPKKPRIPFRCSKPRGTAPTASWFRLWPGIEDRSAREPTPAGRGDDHSNRHGESGRRSAARRNRDGDVPLVNSWSLARLTDLDWDRGRGSCSDCSGRRGGGDGDPARSGSAGTVGRRGVVGGGGLDRCRDIEIRALAAASQHRAAVARAVEGQRRTAGAIRANEDQVVGGAGAAPLKDREGAAGGQGDRVTANAGCRGCANSGGAAGQITGPSRSGDRETGTAGRGHRIPGGSRTRRRRSSNHRTGTGERKRAVCGHGKRKID